MNTLSAAVVLDAQGKLATTAIGIGVVFAGLIAIIILCKIASAVIISLDKKSIESSGSTEDSGSAGSPGAQREPKPSAAAGSEIGGARHGELMAAISAAIAEFTGKDVSGIRILSIREEGKQQ